MNPGCPAPVATLIITMLHNCKEERVQLKEVEVLPRILSLPPSQPHSTLKANTPHPRCVAQMNADSLGWAWAPPRVLGPSDPANVALLSLSFYLSVHCMNVLYEGIYLKYMLLQLPAPPHLSPWLPCQQQSSLSGQAVSLRPYCLISHHLVLSMGWAHGSTFREGFVTPWKNWK